MWGSIISSPSFCKEKDTDKSDSSPPDDHYCEIYVLWYI